MAVNKNIWETMDTITINNATYERSKQISNLFSNGKLVLNTDFDKSIYMWDREPIIYNGYRLNDKNEIYIDRKGVDKRTTVTVATGSSGYFPVGFPNSNAKTPLTYAMRPNQKEATRPQHGNVITDFDYKTIVFCIYVLASVSENNSQMTSIPLKQYFESSYTQYPYIRGVVARSFCGVNKNRALSGQIVASTYTNFYYQDFHDKTETVYLSSTLAYISVLSILFNNIYLPFVEILYSELLLLSFNSALSKLLLMFSNLFLFLSYIFWAVSLSFNV